MKALTFRFNLARLAAAKMLGSVRKDFYLSRMGPVSYREIPEPTLPGPDWLLLQTTFCGICGSDLKQVFLDGARDNPLTSFISFPHVMGHEIVGRVAEVGANVRDLSRDVSVVAYPWLSCEVRGLPPCEACQSGTLMLCRNFTSGGFAAGMHLGTCRDLPGGFAPLIAVHRSLCFPVPEAVSASEAALADPFAVAFHAVQKSPPRSGEKVLVIGCGTLGLLIGHIVHRLYPGVEVIGVDRFAHIEPLAQQMGFHHLVTCAGAELVEALGELTKSKVYPTMAGGPWLLGGVDRIYDTVGMASTLETGLRVVRTGGPIVVVGVATPARFEWTPLYFKEIQLIGSNGCAYETVDGSRRHGFELFLDLTARARVACAPIITHTFPLAHYREAFMTAQDKVRHRSVKVLFDLDP